MGRMFGTKNGPANATAANLVPVAVDANGALIIGAGNASVTIGATTDAGPAQTISHGISGNAVTSSNMVAAANVSNAPTAGQKLVVTDLIVSANTAMTITFKDSAGLAVLGPHYLTANGPPVQITLRGKYKLATANSPLQAQASVAGNITIDAFYYSEA